MAKAGKHPLLAWRERNGTPECPMSQEQAAEQAGITQAFWSQIEQRRRYAAPSVARRISDLTGVPIESLLNFREYESGGQR